MIRRTLGPSSRARKTQFARNMRKNPTPSERKLWEQVRRKKLGFRFRRQALLQGYIADFWCPKAKLVVEVDGSAHQGHSYRDRLRDQHLSKAGIRTLRFDSRAVLSDVDTVVRTIQFELDSLVSELR